MTNEGLISVSMSIVYPVLFILSTGLLLLVSKKEERTERSNRAFRTIVALATGVAYGVVGYFTVSDPAYSADWDRLVWEMSTAEDTGLLALMTGSYSAHPLSAILVYFVGLTGNPALLRFISCFLFVVLVQFLIVNLINYGCRPVYSVYVWALIMSCLDFGNMLLVNIRFELAAMLFLYAAFELGMNFGGRRWAWALAAIAIFLHSSMLLLAATCLVASTTKGSFRAMGLILLLCSGLLVRISEPILGEIPILGAKVSLYVENGWSGANMQLSNKTVLFNTLLLVAGLLVPILLSRDSLWSSSRIKGSFLPRFAIALSCLSIGFAFLTDNFTRFAQLIPIAVSPIIALWLSESETFQDGESSALSSKRIGLKANIIKVFAIIYVVICLTMRSVLTLRFYEIVL